ncbi:MAG: trypsin-like peptidase domain-containing protein [Ruminococcus sp.]|nr:trypsin-like peptidase domain-containing protein [Ruminococcus sp.]
MNEYNKINLDDNSPKPKKHTLHKVSAFLMAMVLVSGGSIAVYREFTANPVSAVEESAEAPSDSKSSVSVKNMSFINTTEDSDEELSTVEIVQKVLPSVVGVESQFTVTSNNNGYYYGFGNGFGNMPSTSTTVGTGTGVVITEDGYIVTNAHVIYDSEYGAGLADSIKVLMSDDNNYDAEVIGYDTDCDLAVLKINADGLTPAELGDSDSLMLGEDVVAIGNPLGFDLMNTVTRGIVSGLNRNITINDKAMNLIQTDTAINSGNSGGPLINKKGQVIGINSSKMSSSYGSASIEGIGFAIPSNETARIIDDLMSYGYVTGKPQLGISCQDVTETVSQMYNMPVGIYITEVSEGSASEKAGLKSGDIITAVDGEKVETAEELSAKKNTHNAGDTIRITYVRNGREETTDITLDEIKKEK